MGRRAVERALYARVLVVNRVMRKRSIDMAGRSEQFGRLLKAGMSSIANCEGKTSPLIEEELGEKIGVTSYTIQRYKAGQLPSEARATQILAEACVERGHLNREWLQAFLYSARYPYQDMLLEKLCPGSATRAHPPRVYENLPAPTYSQFIMRQQPYDQILDGLRQRSAVVLIASMGGMGKTSLAREVAADCLTQTTTGPSFDAAVWVSDKDGPGSTNLSLVLDHIARTLDYPGLIQLSYTDKRYEVEQLLRRQKVLLVVDNFETITDGSLLEWLLRLPEPSKALITTRENRREFRSSWPIDLHGMTETEAQALIIDRLKFLKLEKLTGDQAQWTPLIQATGGNPKAIELTLGLLKYQRQPLQQILDDVRRARGKLFDDLFARAWSLLDMSAQRVLLSLTLFSTSASHASLSTTVDMHDLAFTQAIDTLADLALLDVQYLSALSHPRYVLHPLVRVFARQKLAEQPALEASATRRWIGWCRQLADQVGFCWDNLDRLDLLDLEHETIHAALQWSCQNQRYDDVIPLVEGLRYYYNVRGLWDDRLMINLWRVEAARKLGDRSNEVLGLAHYIESRSKQGDLVEAACYYEQLEAVAQSPDLPDDVIFEIQHARALYARASGDTAKAEHIWRELLEFSARLGGQKYVVNRRWLATCRYQQGDLETAQQLYREALQDAHQINDQRSVVGNQLKLAAIDLDQGRTAEAEAALTACRAITERFRDRRRLGELHSLTARLHILRGDLPSARTSLMIAIDLFERLRMRRELAAAHATLANIVEV